MAVSSVSQKLLRFLQKNLPYSYNAKTLFRSFKGDIPQSTIKTELYRLLKSNKVVKESRGFYRAKVSPELLHIIEKPPTLLHGICLVCECPKEKLQKWGQGGMQQGYTEEQLSWFKSNNFLPYYNYNKKGDKKYFVGYIRTLHHLERRITVTIYQNGKIAIYINSTKHPLSYPEFVKLLEFLNGYLHDWMPFSSKNVVLSEIGLAKDYKRLRLEGVSSVSLSSFKNAWSRVYYKEDIGATRFEYHINTNLVLSDALQVLESLNYPKTNGNGFVRPDEKRDVA